MTLRKSPRLVLDAAHNEQGVEVALRTWRETKGEGPERVIFGCLKDKAVGPMLRKFRRHGGELWGVALPGPRGSDPLSWPISPDQFFGTAAKAMAAERREPRNTLVLGSLVLAGEVLRALGVKVG